MLANGTTLAYKEKGASGDYTDLPGLKEIPEMGVDPQKIDNTCLSDSHMKYENGIGDLPDMVYKFKWDNKTTGSAYKVLKNAEKNGSVLCFQEKMSDGTTTEFEAQVSVKRTGGGVNGVIDADVTMTVQSDITITDPA